MFFAATAHPVLRRPTYASAAPALERFMDEALRSSRAKACAYEQDETSFTLSLDVPGITKEQLSVGIEGTMVRVNSKEGAPRSYRVAYELPLEIDSTTSEAKLENGVLTLKLTKKVPVSNTLELVIQ